MRLKTIFVIVVAVLITIVIMQNSSPVMWKILFFTTYTSRLKVLFGIALLSFIIGYLAGRPRKTGLKTDYGHGYNEPTRDRTNDLNDSKPSTLSGEDRDYISND